MTLLPLTLSLVRFFDTFIDEIILSSLCQKYFPPAKNNDSLIVQQSFGHGAERADIIKQETLG